MSFKKHAFDDGVLTLMVVYRNQSMQIQEFLSVLQNLVTTYSIDIKAGDFNYDVSESVGK